MPTKNNWFNSNLAQRRSNPIAAFDIEINLYPFEAVSFAQATIDTCNELRQNFGNLYIALSGGMDSEYALRSIKAAGIPITPIIVVCSNIIETNRARKLCNELKIKPMVIRKTEEELIDYFVRYIREPFNGIGYNSAQAIVAGEFVDSVGGTLITGNHFLGDGNDMITESGYLPTHEWDCYIHNCFDRCEVIDFFLYTPAMAYASLPQRPYPWNKYKSNLYGIPIREKLRPVYSKQTQETFFQLIKHQIPASTSVVWTKSKTMALFDQYKI